MDLLQELVDLENMSVSERRFDPWPPQLKSLSSSITTRQEFSFFVGRSGKDSEIIPIPFFVVGTDDTTLSPPSTPPAMTRPHDSELAYPERDLCLGSVPVTDQ